MNKNGRLLLSLCTEHNLVIANIFLRTDWRSPGCTRSPNTSISSTTSLRDLETGTMFWTGQCVGVRTRFVRSSLVASINTVRRQNLRSCQSTMKINTDAFTLNPTKTLSHASPPNNIDKMWESLKFNIAQELFAIFLSAMLEQLEGRRLQEIDVTCPMDRAIFKALDS